MRDLTHLTPQEKRMWQTLVRVDALSEDGRLLVVIPGWNPGLQVEIPLKDVPIHVSARMQPGFRCVAHVNIGVERVEDLIIEDWDLI